MEDKHEEFLSSCSEVDFGSVVLSEGEIEFYKGFNREIMSLCDSLPESVQTDALLFFMKYSGLSIGQELNFYKNFYVPSWSIIYWLARDSPGSASLSPQDTRNAMTAHAMAMKVHSLDDHINDREIPADHLTLLLRSQSWMRMIMALKDLACGLEEGENIINRFMNDYYTSIMDSEPARTLDGYCQRFLRQMATWMIVPVLLTKVRALPGKVSEAVQRLYGSFGIAWRLLDDIMDIEADMKKGAHSAVYVCLPEGIRKLWDKNEMIESNNDNSFYDIILDYIHTNSVSNRIRQRISKELESAASISENHNMTGLAGELRSLLNPFSG